MRRPSGDQGGGMLGRHGATNEIHGADGSLLPSARSSVPAALATINSDESVGRICVLRKAMRRPSGDQEIGLATLAMNSFAVPPRNGTRHTSACPPFG